MRGENIVRQLPVRSIQPDPDQPRKVFAEDALAQLAASIQANGLLQPISVRPIAGGAYLLIAGERRWRAVQRIGWETVPALVRDIDPADAAKLQLLENIVRADLNPIEEARAYKRFLDEGLTVQQVGEVVGLATSQIGWRVKMLDAPDEVLHLVATGQMKPAVAFEIAKLSPSAQQRAMRLITQQGMSYQQAIWACQQIQEQEAQTALFALDESGASFGRISEKSNETGTDFGERGEEQQRVARRFEQVWSQLCDDLQKLAEIEEDHADDLAKALRVEAGVASAKLRELRRSIERLERALERERIREVVAS